MSPAPPGRKFELVREIQRLPPLATYVEPSGLKSASECIPSNVRPECTRFRFAACILGHFLASSSLGRSSSSTWNLCNTRWATGVTMMLNEATKTNPLNNA